MKKPIWSPSIERYANSNLVRFIDFINEKHKKELTSFFELYYWSIDEHEKFWESLLDFSEIKLSKSFDKILIGNEMFGAKYFSGAELNFAENLLRFNDDEIAIISVRENFENIKITYAQLNFLTAKCADALAECGIKKGDRVAGYISNLPEAVIAMLATTSLGAIWTSCSPDFGDAAVIDRFEQIKPKILFASEAYSYNGKVIDNSEKISAVMHKIKSIEKLIKIPINNNPLEVLGKKKKWGKDSFNTFINNKATKIKFEQNSFDHPVYILYSSGTTGKPKCIVHGAGGTLLQHYKELALHTDLKREDTIFYFTTCGWMMWNWLVSSLFIGAKVVLFDGSPTYPNIDSLWQLSEVEKISIFGTSPKFLSLCEKQNCDPSENFSFENLKTILSTGSPLSEQNFHWVYERIKKDVQLSSISGGTDIISCFMLGSPMLPVYAGEIQTRGLGMSVDVYDEEGNSINGEVGELVCKKPFPSMPLFFWNDEENKKYKESYFNFYEGVWRHGDFIELTENDGIITHGRSDATLNPGGVRIGTAEIYNIVEAMDEVLDSLVVGQKWNNDVRVILFIVLDEKVSLDQHLTEKIKHDIKYKASPRHVPNKIIRVTEIPRTINGKKVELAVTRIINEQKIENLEVLQNPSSLKQYENIPQLQD